MTTKSIEAKSVASTLIKSKKTNYFKQKILENTGNSKKLWKTLNSLGMPSKKGSESSVCLEKDGNISFDPKINAGIFKDFYSNLASDLVIQLPSATSKYDMNYVRDYCQFVGPGCTITHLDCYSFKHRHECTG